jgi:hypothetical protein
MLGEHGAGHRGIAPAGRKHENPPLEEGLGKLGHQS